MFSSIGNISQCTILCLHNLHHNNLTAVNKVNVKKKNREKLFLAKKLKLSVVTKLAYWYQVTNQGVVYRLALQEEQCKTEI